LFRFVTTKPLFGIERSEAAVQQADVALVLLDPREGLNATTQAILAKLPEQLKRIEIQNKIDLTQDVAAYVSRETEPDLIKLSAKTGEGLDLLRQALLQQVGWQGDQEGLFLARERHVQALLAAQQELDFASQMNTEIELLAEHLRLAQISLGEITGEFTADDLLGVIFSRFCIGK